MRSALICHAGDRLNEEGVARWLGGFSELRVVVRITEPRSRLLRRLRREVQRSGVIRLFDILAFRILHTLRFQKAFQEWTDATLAQISREYPPVAAYRVVECASVNEPHVAEALRDEAVEFALARCKQIISKRVYHVPPKGVYVLHPGICPEYRNAHGCFWAMAEGDFSNVGTSLLRIDDGVDTGPVYAYFRTQFDMRRESPLVIQERTLFDNLPEVARVLSDVLDGKVGPQDTSGRESRAWGQPWLSAWLRFFRS
ncbi:MAG: hypothetical protein K2R93_09750 [Gemmatimonadaceae bacterium]|nr:hypothetical protein [Gemmatimonadaceae bacterium]